jgi:hypothetical protein
MFAQKWIKENVGKTLGAEIARRAWNSLQWR